ncbi:MAG: NADH-quinone oxidoreductase subunit J, partial [Fibrella sp.]|nr:NADH-quinone oxidoreductase subunit J [Armatimonadota bacterium]
MPSLELIQAFLAPQVLLFLTFGFGALATALTMLLHPNPVRAALFLVLNLFCVAVLYLLLNAYFLAAVQVVVYAGAIMVLFLFVIMLLNLGSPDRTVDRLRSQQPLAALAGLVLAGAVAITLVRTMPLPKLDAEGNPPQLKRPVVSKSRMSIQVDGGLPSNPQMARAAGG